MKWSDPGEDAPALIKRLPPQVRAYPDFLAIAILTAVSLAVRVRHLPRPFHGDEMITFSNMVLGRDIGGIIFGPFDSNSHLLNSVIMKAVHLWAGESPALMRLPNLVFVMLAIVLLYLASSQLIGRVPAFAAALLLSLHPAMVLYSVFARGYAGVVLFTLVSSILFVQVVHRFSWRRLLISSATGFLAGAFHLFAVNVLIAQAVLAVVAAWWPGMIGSEAAQRNAGRKAATFLGPVTALALLVGVSLPSLRTAFAGSSDYLFQAPFPVALVNFLGGNAYRTDLDWFSPAICVVALIGLLSLKKLPVLQIYLGLLYLSPISLYVLSYFVPRFTLHPRFFVFLLPFTCFLAAAGSSHVIEAIDTDDRRRWSSVVRGAAVVFLILVASVFVDRIDVPRGKGFIKLQREVGEFMDAHPVARFLTNDTGFVRVRLRQEGNMDRIHSALSIKTIRAYLDDHPDAEVYFIHVPRKRYTKTDLIHYQGTVAPEVQYQRDDRLRTFLEKRGTAVLDLPPRVRIYALGAPVAP